MEKIIVCVCVCVNSTFGRCCDCPCWKEETLYFTKIDKNAQGEEDIKKCINNKWYAKYQDKVLLLQEANESDTDVLKVTGSGNKWTITDPQGNKFKYDKCDSGGNKWIIVKVITWDDDSKSAGDSFIFYVDEIKNVNGTSVFESIRCYSIDIIAANTSAVKSMSFMFRGTTSALELDEKEDTAPGLIGLDKLNVENVEDISMMFYHAIHKQTTLKQLGKWRFSGEKSVFINCSIKSTVKGLDFAVLNDWNEPTNKGAVSFTRASWSTSEQVFVESGSKEDFTAPRWYNYIKNGK